MRIDNFKKHEDYLNWIHKNWYKSKEKDIIIINNNLVIERRYNLNGEPYRFLSENEFKIYKLKNKLKNIEQELEKVRGCSVLTHGWQTQKFAKASRKWDELSKEKFELQKKIDELNKNGVAENLIE